MSYEENKCLGRDGSGKAGCAGRTTSLLPSEDRQVRISVYEAKLAALNTAIASGNFPLTKDNAERAAEAIEAAFAKIKY